MILMNQKCSSLGNKLKNSFDCNAVEKIDDRDQWFDDINNIQNINIHF